MKQLIPAIRHAEFVELWNDRTATGGYIREFFGVSWCVVESTRLALGLPQRPSRSHDHWEPTEAEIEQRAAEARAKWSHDRELSRQSAGSRRRYEVPVYSIDQREMVLG